MDPETKFPFQGIKIFLASTQASKNFWLRRLLLRNDLTQQKM